MAITAIKDARWELSIFHDRGWMWLLTSPDDLGSDYMFCQSEREQDSRDACIKQAESIIKVNEFNVIKRRIEGDIPAGPTT